MPVCEVELVGFPEVGAKHVFRDARARSAPLDLPVKKSLTKLDQGVLDDLILHAGGTPIVSASSTHLRQKRSLSGNFSISTYLRARDSPYEVMSDLLIPEGVTVNVEKGVELRFRPGLGLTVKGRLVARGTRDDPILLQPLIENSRWRGLTFEAPFKAYGKRK